MSLKKRFITTI